jgi:hypothetical protein
MDNGTRDPTRKGAAGLNRLAQNGRIGNGPLQYPDQFNQPRFSRYAQVYVVRGLRLRGKGLHICYRRMAVRGGGASIERGEPVLETYKPEVMRRTSGGHPTGSRLRVGGQARVRRDAPWKDSCSIRPGMLWVMTSEPAAGDTHSLGLRSPKQSFSSPLVLPASSDRYGTTTLRGNPQSRKHNESRWPKPV